MTQLDLGEVLEALVARLTHFVIVVLSPDARFQSWHPGVERVFGFERQEFIGMPVDQLFTPADRLMGVPAREFQQARDSGAAGNTRWLYHRDGRRVLVDGITLRLDDAKGQMLGFGKVMRSMTAQFEMQEHVKSLARALEHANGELMRAGAELQRSNQELLEFASIASHDLSAPLRSARWLVDLLESRHAVNLADEGKQMIVSLGNSLDRMSDLMDGILDHARIGLEILNPGELVESEIALGKALENLHRDMEASDAQVHHSSLPAVYVSEAALTQLFQNLLSNAIKYVRPGHRPEIHVGIEREDRWWKFSVGDNGIGIAPAWQERIFEPMQRNTQAQVPGSGIGLATCRKIVERSGGRIWVESMEGKGSTFYFTLPSTEEVDGDGGSAASITPPSPS